MVRRVIFLTGLLVLLLSTGQALAGGWVVITIETMPEQIHAGEPVQFSFMVRQHGKTPTHGVNPLLTATNAETGQRIQVNGDPAQELGRFTAKVNFPSAGAWDWSISAEPFPQTVTFAPLTVLVAGQMDGPHQSDQAGFSWRALLRSAGLVLLAIAVLLFSLDRQRGREVSASTPGE